MSNVKHPNHYQSGAAQGDSSVYETIKVIEAWDLGFHLGNTVKYISRAGKKHDDVLEDLKKAKWYLDRFIGVYEKESATSLDATDTAPKL
tara:strand:- start:69 stop:338 length:270 start_codon:yes stop_codon:yes gene_type:complete